MSQPSLAQAGTSCGGHPWVQGSSQTWVLLSGDVALGRESQGHPASLARATCDGQRRHLVTARGSSASWVCSEVPPWFRVLGHLREDSHLCREQGLAEGGQDEGVFVPLLPWDVGEDGDRDGVGSSGLSSCLASARAPGWHQPGAKRAPGVLGRGPQAGKWHFLCNSRAVKILPM